MKCHNCDGLGDGGNGQDTCFICNGSGTLCDICGEPSDADIETCYECEAEAFENPEPD